MDSYNGFSGNERAAMDRAIRRGEAPVAVTVPPCAMCGHPSPAKTQTHAEDYSKPFRWGPPATYQICIPCHRRLHARFKSPDRWASHCAFLRRGWYGREATNDELIQHHSRGAAYEWGSLTHEPPIRSGSSAWWWESLSLTPIDVKKTK